MFFVFPTKIFNNYNLNFLEGQHGEWIIQQEIMGLTVFTCHRQRAVIDQRPGEDQCYRGALLEVSKIYQTVVLSTVLTLYVGYSLSLSCVCEKITCGSIFVVGLPYSSSSAVLTFHAIVKIL